MRLSLKPNPRRQGGPANTEQRTQARNKLQGLPPNQTSTRTDKKLTEQGKQK